jgi:acetyltransferase-like isoleucine patch superfamily enzyme
MRRRLRLFGLALTSLMPGLLKRFVYRHLFGFRVGRRVRIGLALLDCASLSIGDDSKVGHGTAFLRCGDVSIGSHVEIGPLNLFRGGDRLQMGDYSQVLRLNVINAIPDNDVTPQPDSSFYLGYGSVITAEHRIDFTDRVRIGRRSIIGGRNSSLWTHNRKSGVGIEIGDYCYIGSEIRMAPGSRIPDYSIVGLGAVVADPLLESYSLFAGVPARRRRALGSGDLKLIFEKTRPDLPDEAHVLAPFEEAIKETENVRRLIGRGTAGASPQHSGFDAPMDRRSGENAGA